MLTRQRLLERGVGVHVVQGTEVPELLGDLVVLVLVRILRPFFGLFGFFSETGTLRGRGVGEYSSGNASRLDSPRSQASRDTRSLRPTRPLSAVLDPCVHQ